LETERKKKGKKKIGHAPNKGRTLKRKVLSSKKSKGRLQGGMGIGGSFVKKEDFLRGPRVQELQSPSLQGERGGESKGGKNSKKVKKHSVKVCRRVKGLETKRLKRRRCAFKEAGVYGGTGVI